MLNALEMQPPIVFFDGVCNLCNGFVDWLIRHDTRQRFKVASLQGSTAQRTLPMQHIQNLGSVVLFYDGQIFVRSTAVLMIFADLAAPWRQLAWLKVLPLPVRDSLYDLVAKYRYLIFGKRLTCRIPSADEKSRFLD